MTPQRAAILHALHHTGGHLSPTQVYEMARMDYPRLTELTVYRTLDELTEKRFLLPRMWQRENGYELAGTTTIIISSAAIATPKFKLTTPRWKSSLENWNPSSGFRSIDSHVTFFGLCPECQKQKGD